MIEKNEVNRNWHPLKKFIKEVKLDYYVTLYDAYRLGYINKDTYETQKEVTDFITWLEWDKDWYLTHFNQDYTIARFFEPLMIRQDGDLCLFKYKKFIQLQDEGYDFTTFFDLYDGLYLECRSVVFNLKTLNVVIAAQRKFKNYGEEEYYKLWSKERVLNALKKCNGQYFITEKMDGSMVNITYDNEGTNSIVIASSSNIGINNKDSWRNKEALRIFNSNIGYERLLREFPNITFMFEYVSPKNPVVVHYTKEQEGLYLFGARDNSDGEELNPVVLFEYANKYHVPHVNLYLDLDFDDICKATKNYTCNEKEGWVIAIEDNDYPGKFFKVKLKVDDYILMHRMITSITSANTVVQMMADGNIDDFYSKVPDSHKELIYDLIEEIGEYERNMYCQMLLEYSKCMDYVNSYLVFNYNHKLDVNENSQRFKKIITVKFMEAVDKYCQRETKGYCRTKFLNSFGIYNPPRPISMLHNGREIDKGRSYKKIEEIRRWNRQHEQETMEWYNGYKET